MRFMTLARKGLRRLRQKQRTLYDAVLRSHCLPSYSQLAEDRMIEWFLTSLPIHQPTYLDIGACHPQRLSNTYLLYLSGSRGVCIEPDPERCAHLRRARPGDVCLNVGIGNGAASTAPLYLMSPPGLNTFSEVTANRYRAAGHVLRGVVQTPLRSVNDVMDNYFSPWPNLISMDVEGLELTILNTFDHQRFRPEVFCIETLAYPSLEKNHQLIDLVVSWGYVVFADTMLNTIFVRQELAAVFAAAAYTPAKAAQQRQRAAS